MVIWFFSNVLLDTELDLRSSAVISFVPDHESELSYFVVFDFISIWNRTLIHHVLVAFVPDSISVKSSCCHPFGFVFLCFSRGRTYQRSSVDPLTISRG